MPTNWDYGPDTDAAYVDKMLTEYVKAISKGEQIEECDAAVYLQEMVLDIEVHGRRSANETEWTVHHVEVLIGMNGPTQWVTFREADRATVYHTHLPDKSAQDMDRDVAADLATVWGVDYLLEEGN